MSQAVSSDSESEVEPFIIQTKAALVAVLQLSFRKTIVNLHLRLQTTSKQLTISIFTPRIFRPTCLFTDKEDIRARDHYWNWQGNSVEEWSTNTTKHKEVNYHVFMEYTSSGWLVKERNTLPWQWHFRGSVEFLRHCSISEIDEPPTKKIRECGAKETQLSLILAIAASCLIFPKSICKFVLYEKLIKMRGDYVLICKGDKWLIPLAY